MSTRSFIILKVRKEDIGKEISFNPENLPVPVKEWSNEKGNELSQPVKIEKEYIGIYCHWDGYREGVGAALKAKFTDYDAILNLIVGGSCSCITDEYVCRYGNRAGEEWEYIDPWQGNDKNEQPDCWQEYVYLFEEGKGWRCLDVYGKSKSYKKF